MELKNEFSWSKSRHELFQKCPRAYYYDRYGSWAGWEANVSKDVREAYVLKHLKNRYAWKGELVHEAIAGILNLIRSDRGFSPEDSLKNLTLRMRQTFKESKTKSYWRDPKKFFGLFEHEYSLPVTDGHWKQAHDSALQCFRDFHQASLLAALQNIPRERFLQIEKLDSFRFEGNLIWVKLDLVFRKEDGQIVIVDWKTGKSQTGTNQLQLGCYALYACQAWGVDLENIKTLEINLSPYGYHRYEMDQTNLELVKDMMRESIKAMKDKLCDPKQNLAQIDDFSFAVDTRHCSWCNFKKICPQKKASFSL